MIFTSNEVYFSFLSKIIVANLQGVQGFRENSGHLVGVLVNAGRVGHRLQGSDSKG